jgi:hypothetical protein
MPLRKSSIPGWFKSLVALAAVLALLQLAERLLFPPREATAPAPPPALRPWDYPGCYDLEVGEWGFSRYVARPDSATRSLLTPPDRVMLLPDSLDEWGRSYGTFRAAPLGGRHDERTGRSLRWFVRADTLWLVWSAGEARAGIALFAMGDSLVGQAIAVRADSTQGIAAAAAWKVNCSTYRREPVPSRPRR